MKTTLDRFAGSRALAVVFLAAAVVLSILNARVFDHLIGREFYPRIASLVDSFESTLKNASTLVDNINDAPAEVLDLFRDFSIDTLSQRDLVYIQIRTPEKALVESHVFGKIPLDIHPNAPLPPFDAREQWNVRANGRPAREIRFPLLKDDQPIGEVRLGYSLARVQGIVRRLAIISFFLTLALMFAMWGGLLWVLRRQIVRPVAQTATQLSGASEHLGRLSRDMASFAAETSDLAAASSRGTDNATQTGKTILVQTTQINDGLRSVLDQARMALTVAQDAVRFMDQTNASIARLGRASSEIEALIKSITKIAGQTNLLSLNATIEAARAGEAGHGFSVVAKEVKELASETARAAEDVRPRVHAIQTDIKTAVAAVNEVAAVMRQISSAQENIAAAVQQQATGTDNIKALVETAAEKNVEILSNASTVSEKARDTSAGAQETLKAAEDLERLARELHARVSIF